MAIVDIIVRAAVPSGASTGIYEAVELRDGAQNDHFGKSIINVRLCLRCFTINRIDVTKAIENVNNIIAPALKDSKLDIKDQSKIDDLLLKLDGTDNKSNLGANAILGVSMAVIKASASEMVINFIKIKTNYYF